jgi:hypothetical protein
MRNIMSDVAVEGATTGRVVGYAECWDSSSTKVKALIQVGTRIIDVKLEFLQYEYIGKESPVGSIVTVWSQDGEWHFEGRPSREPSKSGLAMALKKAGERTSGIRRELLGPSREEISAEKFYSEVDLDMDYIKSSIGTIDLGVLDEDEYMRQVEHEFLNKTNGVIEGLDLSRWRAAGRAQRVNS